MIERVLSFTRNLEKLGLPVLQAAFLKYKDFDKIYFIFWTKYPILYIINKCYPNETMMDSRIGFIDNGSIISRIADRKGKTA